MTKYDQFYIGQMLRQIIINDENLASKVGSRVYPNELPDSTSYKPNSGDLPAIKYQFIDDMENDESGMSLSTWQLTVVAGNQSTLQEICSTLKKLLNRYKNKSIRYISYQSSSYEIDPDTKTPYAPLTFRVKYF